MELSTRPAQIVAIIVVVAALFCFSWLTVWGQDELQGQGRIKERPIVSDEVAVKTDTLRVVTKDEFQRIVDDMILRIQKLETRVSILEEGG